MSLYFAYGSNLSHANMRRRCPRARPLKAITMTHAKLVFRGVADVTKDKGAAIVQGGLWKITGECEKTLDTFEGVRSRFYLKRYIPVMYDGRMQDMLFYQMRMKTGIMPPTEAYLDTIAQGYRDFGLELAYLDVALQEAWGNKTITQELFQRHVRKGRPKLAQLSA
jgi:gamma-glutamylcyclotransferase (GGCT)/AIG2-like uncharacterized protein YtfP